MFLFKNMDDECEGDYNESGHNNDKKLDFFLALAMFNAMNKF